MNYKYFKENPVKIRGVVHAGAHRGDALFIKKRERAV